MQVRERACWRKLGVNRHTVNINLFWGGVGEGGLTAQAEEGVASVRACAD